MTHRQESLEERNHCQITMCSHRKPVTSRWQRTCGLVNIYPISSLTVCFILWKLILVSVIIASPGPGYDTSTTLLRWAVPKSGEIQANQAAAFKPRLVWLALLKFVRWDAIYFIQIAERGYLFEQEWAFGYGYTRLLSTLSSGGFSCAVLAPKFVCFQC